MRIYSGAQIKEELLTGFQSPCSEYAEKPLSFDERFGVGNPSLRLITCEAHFFQFDILKNDQLLVDLSKRPSLKSLIVTITDDEIKLFQIKELHQLRRFSIGLVENHTFGVVRLIIRHIKA